jgi:hypothetical protein
MTHGRRGSVAGGVETWATLSFGGVIMRAVAGAILILAGSVLFAAGIIADGVNKGQGGYGNAGYFLGAGVVAFGVVVFLSKAAKRAWEGIPVEEKNRRQPV